MVSPKLGSSYHMSMNTFYVQVKAGHKGRGNLSANVFSFDLVK